MYKKIYKKTTCTLILIIVFVEYTNYPTCYTGY